jgi:hypothetical protein
MVTLQLNHVTSDREWRQCELSKRKGSSHSINCSHLANDVSNLGIHTSLMVMRSEKVKNTLNSKVSKLRVYLMNKTRPFMWWKNHFVTLW